MQILVRHNRVIDYCAEGYLCMGEYVLCDHKGKSFTDCTVIEVTEIPNDIDFYAYYYIEGKFVREAPIAYREYFADNDWTVVGRRVRHSIVTKRPIIAVYRLNDDATFSLVTNADINMAADGTQFIQAGRAFTGYVVTI